MKKILLVDDESFFLKMLHREIKSPSTEVKTVETGKEALQEIAADSYHYCFLDICLPDVDGIEVMQKIAEVSPKTKIIIMTAGYVADNIQKLIEKHAYMFLNKPFDSLQLRMLTKNISEGATV